MAKNTSQPEETKEPIVLDSSMELDPTQFNLEPAPIGEPLAEASIEEPLAEAPIEETTGKPLEELQQAEVALGEANVPVKGTEEEAQAMTVAPVAQGDIYASIDKPLYGARQKNPASMQTYAVSVKDAYAPEHPAYSNADARTQYFITATSKGAAIAQLKQVFPQYSEFEAKLL